MSCSNESTDSVSYDASAKQKSQAKTARIPIKIIPAEKLKKPDWIRVKAATGNSRFYEIKQILREHNLHTVCERHGDFYDYGRQMYASLPVLRCRPRAP